MRQADSRPAVARRPRSRRRRAVRREHAEVAGVRVGVQEPHPCRAGEQEPHVERAEVVAGLLVTLGDEPGQRTNTVHPGRDQHPLGSLDHRRHDDVRVVGEALVEALLGVGLQPVVELLAHPGLQLGDQRLHVDVGQRSAEEPGRAGDLAQVGAQRVARARVLHLDRDLTAVVPDRPVHLSDRRRSRRVVVEGGEPPAPAAARAHAPASRAPPPGPSAAPVLQPGQGLAVRPGQLVGQCGLEDRKRLPELHGAALELAEHPEQLLGCPCLYVGEHGVGRPAHQSPAEATVVRPANPSGSEASRAVLAIARRGSCRRERSGSGSSLTGPLSLPTRSAEQRTSTTGVDRPRMPHLLDQVVVEAKARTVGQGRSGLRCATTSRADHAASAASSTALRGGGMPCGAGPFSPSWATSAGQAGSAPARARSTQRRHEFGGQVRLVGQHPGW